MKTSLRDSFQALLIIALTGGTLITTIAISQATQPTLVCLCPNANLEMVVLKSYTVESSTNVTLTMRNTGSLAVYLVSYTVTDSNGTQYANTSWAGPTIGPNQVVPTNILIDGKSFTFQTTPTSTITVVTLRNNPFTFTITG